MTVRTVYRWFCWSACSAGSNSCSIMEMLPVTFISFYGIWKRKPYLFHDRRFFFFYLKYFYWTLKYFIEMDRVRQPLKRTPKSAPNAAIEGDAWCDQLFRKKGFKFRLFTVPVCLWNNQQLCCPLLTTGQNVLCKATFQSLFFKWLAYNLMPF